MRNLKKILALVLALVMSLSLVTIANASDFTDADDITYEEAADVMSTIGVIEGYEDGSFDPDGTLVREEAAKLVTFMLLGDNANNLGIERSSFNDVAMTRWSAPAIEYCVSLGIIDGAGDGNFYPRGQLTAVAFAKVLLTALGYDADTEGLVGATWSVNTAALAMEVGLDNGIEDLSWNAALTREEAAQMALNAIQAPLVAYEGGVTVVVGDTPVSFGSGDAYYITTTLAREQRISDERLSNSDDYTVEFGERYFPRLRLNTETDEFERPSHTWVYENTELGTYVDYDLLVETYTEGVDGRTLYELLGRSTIQDYALSYYVDGGVTPLSKNDLVRSNTSDIGQTGNGVLTQVFVDHDEEEIVITSINTYLARANGNYNENSETVSLKVYDEETDGTAGDTQIIDVADVPNIVDIVEDQFVLVNMSEKGRDDLEVVKVSDVEILTDTDVTKFSTKKNSAEDESIFTSLTADGEEYDAAQKAYYDVDTLNLYDNNLLTNTSYNVYLDQYGYAIGVDLYEGEMNYVFITGYDRPESNISVRTAQAAGIFLDGRMEEITVNVTATTKNIEDRDHAGSVDPDYDAKYDFWNGDGDYDLNRWFSYTETDGVYTLRPVDEDNMLVTTLRTSDYDKTINCSNVYVADDLAGRRGYGNDNSIYITVEPGKVDTSPAGGAITDVNGLYTGVQNVDIILENGYKEKVPNDMYTLIDDDQYIIASIVLGEAQGSVANYAFILDAPTSERIDRETGIYYWTFDAIMGGKKVELIARSRYQDTIDELVENRMVELRFDGDYVTSAKVLDKDIVTFETEVSDTDEIFDVDTNSSYYAGSNHIVNLLLNGRTLHTGDQSTGLTFVTDAPTVLKQKVNNKFTTTEYSSVEEAYNDLGDAAPNTDGLQFKGRIVAVLNSQGVAEWVYIISDTSVGAKDDGFTDNGSSTTLPSSSDALVRDGDSTDAFAISGAYDADNNELYLLIDGSAGGFNAWASAANFTLDVTGLNGQTRTYNLRDVEIQPSNRTSYVFTVDFDLGDVDYPLFNVISVDVREASATTTEWYVQYNEGGTYNATYADEQITVANRVGAEIRYTIEKPAGVNEYTVAKGRQDNTNIAASYGVNGTTTHTTDLDVVATVATTSTHPVVSIGHTISKEITVNIKNTVTASYDEGFVNVRFDGATSYTDDPSNLSGKNFSYVITGADDLATGATVVVTYTDVAGDSQNISPVPFSGGKATVNIPVGNAGGTITVTGVTVLVSVTTSVAKNNASNLTGSATVAAYESDGTTSLTGSKAIGTPAVVKVTIAQNGVTGTGVNFTLGGDTQFVSAEQSAAGAVTLTFQYEVPNSGSIAVSATNGSNT